MAKRKLWVRIPAVLFTLLLMLFAVCAVVSAEDTDSGQRVYDNAGVFTEAEIETLENSIAKIQERIDGDVLILTSEEVPEDPDYGFDYSENYLREAYTELGLREDGFAYIIDFRNRVLWTTCFGKYVEDKYSSIPEKIYDQSLAKAKKGDYFGAACAFTDQLDRIGNIPRALIPTGISLLISIVLSAAGLLILVARHKSTQPSKANTPALKVNRYRSTRHDEQYLGTSVIRRPIPKNTGGGGGGGGGYSSSSTGGGGHF